MTTLHERAKQIDEARSEELMLLQDQYKQLAQWNADVHNLQHLLQRTKDNMPTQADRDKLELIVKLFER